MAVDKLVDSAQINADLTSVANAIRTKGGTSAQLAFPSGFVSAVQAIPTGGGGSSPFVKLYESTLTEAVQAVKIDITGDRVGYDFYFLTCYGTFASADYWYWNVNATTKPSNQYSKSQKNIRGGLIVAKANSTSYTWGGTNANGDYAFPITFKGSSSNISDLQYLYVQGYSQKMQAGTRITLWGANYADI